MYNLYSYGSKMDFKKGKNGSDIGSNKLENYHFKIFDMVRGYEYFWVRA